jgi:DNA gyrase subunit A
MRHNARVDRVRDLHDGLDAAARAILSRLGDRYVVAERIVGDDEDAYDVLVELARDFVLRHPLVDGRGNFGSIDDDPAADPEYTEVRAAPIAHELAKFPHVLVNGGGGIPPHNLREVAAAVLACLDEPARLLEHLPGPDFPTGGIVVDPRAVTRAYATGRGSLRLRGRASVQGNAVVISELPYGVDKGGEDGVIMEIVTLHTEGQTPGLTDLTDRSDRSGMHVVVGLGPDADPAAFIDFLYERTSLEVTIAIDLVARVDGRPVRMSLSELVEAWLEGRDRSAVRRDLAAVAERFGDPRRTQLGPG